MFDEVHGLKKGLFRILEIDYIEGEIKKVYETKDKMSNIRSSDEIKEIIATSDKELYLHFFPQNSNKSFEEEI